MEDSLNESPPLYGGDPNILILRAAGHNILAPGLLKGLPPQIRLLGSPAWLAASPTTPGHF